MKGGTVVVGVDSVRGGQFQESLTHGHGMCGEPASDDIDFGGLDDGFIGSVQGNVPVVAAVAQGFGHTGGTGSFLVEPFRVPSFDRVLGTPLRGGVVLVRLEEYGQSEKARAMRKIATHVGTGDQQTAISQQNDG